MRRRSNARNGVCPVAYDHSEDFRCEVCGWDPANSSSPPPVPRRELAVLPPGEPHKVTHSYCIDIKIHDIDQPTGSIRLCKHGKIQEIHGERYVGRYWRDISPILNPIRYHCAANRLIAAGIAREA